MSWVGLQPDASKRARLVDADMGWLPGTTLGKMAMIWGESQALRLTETSPKRILLWAELLPGESSEKWISLLLAKDIHFLEQVGEELRIVGNGPAIGRILRQIEKSSKGGKARHHPSSDGSEDDFQPEAEPEALPVAEPQAEPEVVPEVQPQASPRLHLHSRLHSRSSSRSKKRTTSSSLAEVEDLTSSTPDPRWLADHWNQLRGPGQPKVHISTLKPTQERWKSAKARLVEIPDRAYWLDVIKRIAGSDFCNGKNDRKWRADFGFLVKPETHVKAMEGKYDSKAKSSSDGMRVFTDADFQS